MWVLELKRGRPLGTGDTGQNPATEYGAILNVSSFAANWISFHCIVFFQFLSLVENPPMGK